MRYILLASLVMNVIQGVLARDEKQARAMERSYSYDQLEYVKKQCQAMVQACNE
jgi:hypothetical protein